MAGIVAGLLATAAIDVLDRIPPDKPTVWQAMIVAAGPAVAIVAVYILAVPGARQHIGLTGVKVGGVEVSLNAAPTVSPVTYGIIGQPGLPHPSPSDGNGNWQFLYSVLDMAKPTGPTKENLLAKSYFAREAIYLGTVNPDDDPDRSTARWVDAFRQQRDVLHTQEDTIRCIIYYRRVHPFSQRVAQIASRSIEAIAEIHAAYLSSVKYPGIGYGSLNDLAGKLRDADVQMVREFLDGMPNRAQDDPELAGRDDDGGTWTDCVKALYTQIPDKLSLQNPPEVLPPYFAIFLANSLAGTGYPDSGLDVLKQWLSYYDRGEGRFMPKWFHDQALLTLSNILDTSEGFPKSAATRDVLGDIIRTLEADWGIDLAGGGYDCISGKRKKPASAASTALAATSPTVTEARDRLFTAFSFQVQRYLHAAVDSRSSWEQDALGPEHAAWARGLIVSAARCGTWEEPADQRPNREIRQALDLFEGGRTLENWALDGEKSGMLTPTQVRNMREEARDALLQSLPHLRRLVEAQRGPGRLHDGITEPYLQLAQQEILDIDTLLSQ